MARFNLFYHLAPTVEVNGGGYGTNSQVAYYVACDVRKDPWKHWGFQKGQEGGWCQIGTASHYSAEVQFICIPGGNGKNRRVVLLSEFGELDPTLPTLVISAGGGDTWRGAGPRCTSMTRTAVSVVQPGASLQARRHDSPNVVKWHRCLGAFTFAYDSPRVQSLVVAEGPASSPVRRWRKATADEIQAYEAWVNKINS